MVQIVNSLFADYLEPTGIADPRQQTMLTRQQAQPQAQQYRQDPEPTQPPVAPVTKTLESGFTKEPMVAQTKTYTKSEPPVQTVDTSYIDLDALNNLDIDYIDPNVIDNLTYQDVTESLTGIGSTPTTPEDWQTLFNDYSSFLAGVQSGNTANKVNRRDDIYNNYFKQSGGTYQGDPAELRASVGLSDAFSVYDTAGSTVTSDSLQGAYQALTSGANPVEALSAYYGFEIQPAINEGANYTNAAKYGTDAQRMAEFQSLVEPILQKSIPYIQATQGLNYTDALEYAYTHDPMVNALYQSYGVDLYRQTGDGSTYIFDPIAGQEIRTLEVKDAKFKDYLPALASIALGFAGVPTALGTALGASGTTATALGSALMSGTSTLIQGGDLKDALKGAIVSGITAGVSGDLTDAVGKALGVSKDVAAGITSAGLTAAQGGNTEDALLSGFLAGASSYIHGQMAADNQDFEQFGFKGKNPEVTLGGADAAAGSAAAWSNALKGAETFAATSTGADTKPPEIFVGRTTGTPAIDTTAAVTQPVTTTPTIPTGGMLTKDTPAGPVEEVVVTPNNDVLYTVPSKDGVIYQTAKDLLPNEKGERWFEILQEQDPAFHKELLSLIEQNGTDIAFKWRGIPINVSEWYDATSTTTQAPERVPTEPEQPEGASLPDKPTNEDVEPQPPLPPDEDMEIPEFEIENLPPEFELEIPEVVTPPVTPEPPKVPRPTEGGGGSDGGAAVPPPAPVVPRVPTPVTPPVTPSPAAPEAPVEEVVDVFDDGGLTGDAFGDSTTGGAEGGAAQEGSEDTEGGAAEVGGDAGDVDVTTTEQYKALQSELDNALASQSDLEVEVSNLQNEVAAANAAAQQAQEAAAAAEAAGAANADKLRGEALAAQATADSLQGELAGVNAALGNANATIDSLQGRLTGTEAELGNALSTVENLTGELNTAQETANNLSSQLNTAQSELSTLQSEYDKAVESNASNVKSLEGEIEAKESEINDLSSELSDATSTISELEGSLADAQAATEAAIAEGIANAEAAGEEGLGTGLGAGTGIGSGLGGLIGLLGGFGIGQAQGGTTVPYKPTEAKDFMADLSINLPEAERIKQQQLTDYVGMLLGNMR